MNLAIVIQKDQIEKTSYQWLVRAFIVFTFLVVIPLDYKFWVYVFQNGLNFFTLFKLTNYAPAFISGYPYLNIFILVGLSFGIAALWKGKNLNYSNWYHWARVVLRYRLGFILVAYGLLKLFPLQMPFPSLSNLHTNYGDFLPWKIYYHTTGITPWYESFLGLIELTAGVLLFFRNTTTLGAGVIIGFSGNVFAANLAYQAGQEYLSLLILLMAVSLFVFDFKRLFSLLYKFEYTLSNKIIPQYSLKLNKRRLILKSLAGVYLFVLGISFAFSWATLPFKYPAGKGLTGAYGYYNVKTFKIDGRIIPYNPLDTLRWENVVFERWPTVSIASPRAIIVDKSTASDYQRYDYERTYESAGVGGRRYFHYGIDSVKKRLYLVNKNSHHREEKFDLNFEFLSDSTLSLQGSDEHGRKIEALLEKVDKQYMLLKGRRKPVIL